MIDDREKLLLEQEERRRILSDFDKDTKLYVYEDKKALDRPPDEFFSFVKYAKNTRKRLVVSNQDIFIMFGQNWLFACLIIITYLSVWLLDLGKSQSKFVQIYITVQRLLFKIFFIKFQFIVYSELGLHDMSISQPFKYRASYYISVIYSTILLVELGRAYALLKKGYTKEQVLKEIGHEKKQMHDYWTTDFNQKAKDEGNTYLLRDRVRWTIFQVFVAGFQMLPQIQITLILLTQLIYTVLTSKEFKKRRIFRSFWHKLKFVCQDYAILFFLSVLCVFEYTKNSSFDQSKVFNIMEYSVVIAVVIAIGSEVITMFYLAYDGIKGFLKSRKENKNQTKKVKELANNLPKVNNEFLEDLESEIKSDYNKPKIKIKPTINPSKILSKNTKQGNRAHNRKINKHSGDYGIASSNLNKNKEEITSSTQILIGFKSKYSHFVNTKESNKIND